MPNFNPPRPVVKRMRLRALPRPTLRPARLRAAPRIVVPAAPARARVQKAALPALAEARPAAAPRPNPYVDFSRNYSAEGGVALRYKDIDARLRWLILRWALWLGAMLLTTHFALHLSPIRNPLINLAALVGMGWVYWLIVRKPVEVMRSIEVRPDCLILETGEIFFRENMESWPQFVPGEKEDTQALVGTYGTRWMEYLTVARFDENDRAPEVLEAHLRAAMQQQWNDPARG